MSKCPPLRVRPYAALPGQVPDVRQTKLPAAHYILVLPAQGIAQGVRSADGRGVPPAHAVHLLPAPPEVAAVGREQARCRIYRRRAKSTARRVSPRGALTEEIIPLRYTKGSPQAGMKQSPGHSRRVSHQTASQRGHIQASQRPTRRPTHRDNRPGSMQRGRGAASQSTSARNTAYHIGSTSNTGPYKTSLPNHAMLAHKSRKSQACGHGSGRSMQPSATPSKAGSVTRVKKTTLSQSRRKFLQRLCRKASSESDSSWVSPMARALENGKVSNLDSRGQVTSWV